MRCQVRNKITRNIILSIEKLVFVNLNEDGVPSPHGKTEITYAYSGIEKTNKEDN